MVESKSEARIKQALSAFVLMPTHQAAFSQDDLSPADEAAAAALAAGIFRPTAVPVSSMQECGALAAAHAPNSALSFHSQDLSAAYQRSV